MTQVRQSLASDVTVEDLENEQTDRGDRIEDSLSPGVADVTAGVVNSLFVEQLLGVVLDFGDSAGDTGHP